MFTQAALGTQESVSYRDPRAPELIAPLILLRLEPYRLCTVRKGPDELCDGCGTSFEEKEGGPIMEVGVRAFPFPTPIGMSERVKEQKHFHQFHHLTVFGV